MGLAHIRETKPVRVLVVDDSNLMRALISELLSKGPGIEVIGTADNGIAAIEKAEHLRPDVITMDVEMPRMDGLETLGKIMETIPTPVVMVSSVTRRGAEETIKALQSGAVDIVLKPSHEAPGDRIGLFGAELTRKVRLASVAKVRRMAPRVGWETQGAVAKKREVGSEQVKNIVVVGSSTGGPEALTRFFKGIPEDAPAAFLVVQHMPYGFTEPFARRLDRLSEISVREAKEGDVVRNGLALIAPGNAHMKILRRSKAVVVRLETDGPVNGHMPSVDRLFFSAAETFGSSATGVIMTGMGRDGVDGLVEIHKAGGATAAQSEESCVVYGMPREAVKAGCVDNNVFPPEGLRDFVLKKLGSVAQ